MINHLDNLLRRFLAARIPMIPDEDHVVFDPPDDVFRGLVRGSGAMWLNCYLVDLRENRRLRLPGKERLEDATGIRDRPYPLRVECHYLISAWSPAAPAPPASQPTRDEHALLSEVMRVLASAGPFSAAAIGTPPGFPADLVQEDFPLGLLPQEGYRLLAEFWGTMGQNHRLKPVVHLTLTVPLVMTAISAGEPVRAIRTAMGGEELYTFGGTVQGPGGPIPAALVELRLPDGTLLAARRSDSLGRFVFERVQPAEYLLRLAEPENGLQDKVFTVGSQIDHIDILIP